MMMRDRAYSLTARRRRPNGLLTLLTAAACVLLLTGPESRGQNRDYLAALNGPMERVSASNKSYERLFEARMLMDITGAPAGVKDLFIGTPTFSMAVDWISQPDQQDAIETLLAPDDRRHNVAYREIFGLPYGEDKVTDDMLLEDWVVYVDPAKLRATDFAYMNGFQALTLGLIAEGHRALEVDGDGERAVEAYATAMFLARQLADRQYVQEAAQGYVMLYHGLQIIREAMWHYREALTIDNYRYLADELDLMGMDRIQLPIATLYVGEQLVNEVFGADNRPAADSFPLVMAKFEAGDDPFDRFAASAKWNELRSRHAPRLDTDRMIQNVDGDYRRRWRLRRYDPALTIDPLFDQIDPIEYAIVKELYDLIDMLFSGRFAVETELHATIASAGIAAFQKRDGVAPLSLDQVQPTFVRTRESIVDTFDVNYDILRYVVVRRRNPNAVGQGFTVQTRMGRIDLPENSPLLYSIAWDGDDDYGGEHAYVDNPFIRDADLPGDLVFWPPVDLLARTGESAKF
ncbi:MAG: hypothetical protein ACF8PN_05990 [Phycisphaerales bacterium]